MVFDASFVQDEKLRLLIFCLTMEDTSLFCIGYTIIAVEL